MEVITAVTSLCFLISEKICFLSIANLIGFIFLNNGIIIGIISIVIGVLTPVFGGTDDGKLSLSNLWDNHRKLFWISVVAILVGAFLIWFGANYVQIPNVDGKTVREAENDLISAGISFDEISEEYETCKVESTEPANRKWIKSDTVVTINYKKGTQVVEDEMASPLEEKEYVEIFENTTPASDLNPKEQEPIDNNSTIEPQNVSFVVKHYLMNKTGTDYSLDQEEVFTCNGDDEVLLTAYIKSFSGFTYKGCCKSNGVLQKPGVFVNSAKMEANQTNVVSIFYERNKYSVVFKPNKGTCDESRREVYYGKKIGELPVPMRDYYSFGGWYTEKSEGERVDSSSVMQDSDITLYAHWARNSISDWVEDVYAPRDSEVVEEKWTCTVTENIESNTLLDASWNVVGERWQAVESGSVPYATFPYGYDTSNELYQKYQSEPLVPYSDEHSKREVSNQSGPYIYWHWMYNVKYANSTDRTISNLSGAWDSFGNNTGKVYRYFSAFESYEDCPYLDNLYCCSRNLPSYNCRSIIPDTSIMGVGTNRYFRFPTYISTYTDYVKIYTLQKVTYGVEFDYPIAEEGEKSNVQHYVKYRVK